MELPVEAPETDTTTPRPLGPRVLLEHRPYETKGGIILPGKESRWRRGVVLAVGAGEAVEQLGLSAGDEVVYDGHVGVRDFEGYFGRHLVLCESQHVLCVVVP